jgi:hypothetical protein
VFQEEGFAFCKDLFAGGKEAKVEVFVTVRERCAAVETAKTHRDAAGRAEDITPDLVAEFGWERDKEERPFVLNVWHDVLHGSGMKASNFDNESATNENLFVNVKVKANLRNVRWDASTIASEAI